MKEIYPTIYLRKIIFLYLLLLLVSTSSLPVSAQNYIARIQHYGVKDGLSDSKVNKIIEAKDGFIWLATDYGLSRFDGKNFKSYTKTSHGLSGDEIYYIHEVDGKLVLGYKHNFHELFYAIDIFDIESEQVQQMNEILEQDLSIKIKVSGINEMNFCWYLNSEAPFNLVEYSDTTGTLQYCMLSYSSPNGFELIPFEEFGNRIGLGWETTKGTFWKYQIKNRLLELNAADSLLRQLDYTALRPKFIGVDSLDTRWFILNNQSTHYRLEQDVKTQLVAIDKNSEITTQQLSDWVAISPKHNEQIALSFRLSDQSVWFDFEGELVVQHPEKGIIYNFGKELKDITASGIFFDSNNLAWIINKNGFYKVQLEKNLFQYFPIANTNYKGIIEINTPPTFIQNTPAQIVTTGNTNTLFLELGGLPTRSYGSAVIKDRENHLCFSMLPVAGFDTLNSAVTYDRTKGLTRLDLQTGKMDFTPFSPTIDLYDNDCLAIYQDSRGIYWMGHFYGLVYASIEKDELAMVHPFEQFNEFPALKRSKIIAIQEDNKGLIWASTSKGLYTIDAEKGAIARFWNEAKEPSYLPAREFRYIYMQSDTLFWLATDNGLIRWNPSIANTASSKKTNTPSWQQFTRQNGFVSNNIFAIYPDEEGHLWLSSDKGIIQFNPKDFQSKVYSEKEYVKRNYTRIQPHYQSSDGRIYFGSVDQVTAFHPNDVLQGEESYKAPLKIVDFRQYDGQSNQLIDKTFSIIKNKSIILKPEDRFFELHFQLLDYQLDVELIGYEYKIKGYIDEWQALRQGILQMSGLPYGNHILEIRGQGDDGRYSIHELKIPIMVLRPFYLKWGFLLFSGLFIIGMGYFYLDQRTKKLQEQKIQLEKEVSKRTQQIIVDKNTIEEQATNLLQQDQLKTRFFNNVAHELRTPLTLILGPINASLNRNKLKAQDEFYIKMARRSANQLSLLVNSLLDLSKLEVNNLTLQETAVDLYFLMNRLVVAFESSANIQGIQLSLNYLATIPLTIQLDVTKFEIIINNLLSNALKFTPKGGKIAIQVQANQKQVEIKVTDTGKGITIEDLPFIFDRYFQTKKYNQPLEGGTGIGLALCKEYAHLFKGTISVASVLGKGSTFTLVFPKKEATATLTPIESNVSPIIEDNPIELLPVPTTNGQKDKSNLLIVEDNQDMRLYIQTILGNAFQCYMAENGQVAWDWLNDATNSQPDLIISDLMMPFLDGFELLEKIKAHDKWRTIPVVMLTARSTREDRLKTLTLGIDDYLTKPFDAEELVVRVTTLLKNHLARKLQFQSRHLIPPTAKEVQVKLKPITAADIEWLHQVMETIQEDIGKVNLNLLSIAEKMAISERHLRRRIQEITGMNAGAYLKEIKLQQARHFLESKAYKSVAEVAYAVGFNTPSYFAKIYKARFGKLPSAYF